MNFKVQFSVSTQENGAVATLFMPEESSIRGVPFFVKHFPSFQEAEEWAKNAAHVASELLKWQEYQQLLKDGLSDYEALAPVWPEPQSNSPSVSGAYPVTVPDNLEVILREYAKLLEKPVSYNHLVVDLEDQAAVKAVVQRGSGVSPPDCLNCKNPYKEHTMNYCPAGDGAIYIPVRKEGE